MTKVVIAPNAFKGSLTALEAAAAMSAAVATVLPAADIVLRPIADGGDGSIDALLCAGFEPRSVDARDAVGRPHPALIAVRHGEGVVELANTCGLALLGEARYPTTSSTLGLGDAVAAALAECSGSLTLCVGGSASTDGGTGLLVALGVRLLDASGRDVAPEGASLERIADVDLAGLDPRICTRAVRVATDVSSPLLGPTGAARMFGPQKGADQDEVERLEHGMAHWADVLQRATGTDVAGEPGAGAAGGAAFGALAGLGAQVVSGADFIAREVGLDDEIADAQLILTGEGALDEQSLLGKGAVSVVRRGRAMSVPVAMVCGRIDLTDTDLAALDLAAFGSLVDIAPEAQARQQAAALLARRTIEVLAAADLANVLSGP